MYRLQSALNINVKMGRACR